MLATVLIVSPPVGTGLIVSPPVGTVLTVIPPLRGRPVGGRPVGGRPVGGRLLVTPRPEIEKEALEDRLLCTICMEADAPRTVLFGPCNHFLACASCADELQECPNCRVPITARTSIANTS